MSDLLRAHDANKDYKADDPTRIHWAKFNMMGKFVMDITRYQERCRGPSGHKFAENESIGMIFNVPVMDEDVRLFVAGDTAST